MTADYLVGIGTCIAALAAVVSAWATIRGNRTTRSVKEDSAATRHVANAALVAAASTAGTTPDDLLNQTVVTD